MIQNSDPNNRNIVDMSKDFLMSTRLAQRNCCMTSIKNLSIKYAINKS